MSITGIYKKHINIGTPIDPNPRRTGQKKGPPLTIRFSLIKDVNSSLETTIKSPLTISEDFKCQTSSLPPIKLSHKPFRSRLKYLSPSYKLNLTNLRPLFENKKKVDQSLTTKIDDIDFEGENSVQDISYKISVVTKKIS